MKVLIVDDSKLLQSRLNELLMTIDNEILVYQAFNCRQAMELFKTYDPDTVVLDIELPDGSGINLLQAFKKEKPEVRVTIFTNYPTEIFRKGSIDNGAMEFIDKSDILKLLSIMKSLNERESWETGSHTKYV